MSNSTHQEPSFFWYDYETFGISPLWDRPAQFAGVRTDANLNVIDEPLVIYCGPTNDNLPHPQSCLITGITPQTALEKGVNEATFAQQIFQQLTIPNTCGVGYNSIRFDDEFTRFLFYRNFLDPYRREWQHGNSRWDIIDLARMTYALRPEGIEWLMRDDNTPSFKLEDLATANHLMHEQAHDALSDVYATIELAKLIKTKQPKLFHYYYQFRNKQHVKAFLQKHQSQPIIHTSSKYLAKNGCTSMVLPLATHPYNKNGVIAYDLRIHPQQLIDLNAESIYESLFTKREELSEDMTRVPLKAIHINKSPSIAPLKTLNKENAARINLDIEHCLAHAELLKKHHEEIYAKIMQVFSQKPESMATDPDLMLYTGDFFDDHDRLLMNQIVASNPEELIQQVFNFHDTRLPEMLFRYKARNFPDTLSTEEQAKWENFRKERLTSMDNKMNTNHFYEELNTLLNTANESDKKILLELKDYGDKICG